MAAPARRGTSATKAVIPQLTWDQIRPAPVVLVTGTETVLADRSMRLLRDILKAEDPTLEIAELDAGAYAPGELITLASPSLFGEPRFIRVDGVEKMTDAFLDEALSYLEAPADDTYLVLRHAGGVRGKKLLDAIRAGTGGGIEIVCAELKRDSDKLDFVTAEFRRQDAASPGERSARWSTRSPKISPSSPQPAASSSPTPTTRSPSRSSRSTTADASRRPRSRSPTPPSRAATARRSVCCGTRWHPAPTRCR